MTLQKEISDWSRETFGSGTPQVLTKLDNEYRELVDSITILEDSDNIVVVEEDGAAEEAADVLFMLFQLAQNLGFDLIETTREKFEKNRARSWAEQPDGTYQHT